MTAQWSAPEIVLDGPVMLRPSKPAVVTITGKNKPSTYNEHRLMTSAIRTRRNLIWFSTASYDRARSPRFYAYCSKVYRFHTIYSLGHSRCALQTRARWFSVETERFGKPNAGLRVTVVITRKNFDRPHTTPTPPVVDAMFLPQSSAHNAKQDYRRTSSSGVIRFPVSTGLFTLVKFYIPRWNFISTPIHIH